MFFRLRELNGTLQRLERKLDEFTLDFEETVQKVNKSLRRIASERATVERSINAQAEGTEDSPQLPEPSGPLGHLTERQRQIQQQILKRRAGLQ